jgi:hypothetical protein
MYCGKVYKRRFLRTTPCRPIAANGQGPFLIRIASTPGEHIRSTSWIRHKAALQSMNRIRESVQQALYEAAAPDISYPGLLSMHP